MFANSEGFLAGFLCVARRGWMMRTFIEDNSPLISVCAFTVSRSEQIFGNLETRHFDFALKSEAVTQGLIAPIKSLYITRLSARLCTDARVNSLLLTHFPHFGASVSRQIDEKFFALVDNAAPNAVFHCLEIFKRAAMGVDEK